IKVIKDTNGDYMIVSDTHRYSWQEDTWFSRSAFVHSSDWNGVTFSDKSKSDEYLAKAKAAWDQRTVNESDWGIGDPNGGWTGKVEVHGVMGMDSKPFR